MKRDPSALILRIFAVVLLGAFSTFLDCNRVQAQVRGVYPVGMNATNSGVTPEAGLTYSNLFVFFSRDEEKDAGGNVVATGQNSILMDLNTFVWVSKKEIGPLGGAIFSASATLPFANNSLTSDINGSISGGGGFADSYYQPLILSWRKHRADFKVIYGFLAPTGRFSAGTNTNVGSGYWTSVAAGGQTIYLTEDRSTALSAFEMYEFHGTQEGTSVHPGQTLNLDYSLAHTFRLQEKLRLQLAVAGYGQWQTTDKNGPAITSQQAALRYKVNALGPAANVILPDRKVSVGLKYFREFSCESTYQGYTLQISGAITF
ncbi:SphA family protein [Candidatus Korobacter versatilis]|uniref:SphA family protein n=1 Tax=Candidatus Korobacter versatilis TaxID=658062 RepID=UPI0002E1E382|nr:transporter [Candidatus Koribacter versatilis]